MPLPLQQVQLHRGYRAQPLLVGLRQSRRCARPAIPRSANGTRFPGNGARLGHRPQRLLLDKGSVERWLGQPVATFALNQARSPAIRATRSRRTSWRSTLWRPIPASLDRAGARRMKLRLRSYSPRLRAGEGPAEGPGPLIPSHAPSRHAKQPPKRGCQCIRRPYAQPSCGAVPRSSITLDRTAGSS